MTDEHDHRTRMHISQHSVDGLGTCGNLPGASRTRVIKCSPAQQRASSRPMSGFHGTEGAG
eukprot:8200285-Pyramimonas_sp.AAC.1